jgi:peptidyl-prolyl cis-trans isomerase B (cyclophilin B)
MGINKKRIAQRQREEAEAKKRAKNQRVAKLTSIITAAAIIVAVFTVAIVYYILNNRVYYADIQIRDYGTITVQLDRKAAPLTCENFIDLAESGFYDGLTFHRIIEGFMMQGGDPKGDGSGGSEKKLKGEFAVNGWDKNTISHTAGVISMARSEDLDSASSQFFICHKDSTHLDKQYAAFGHVVSGMDIVDSICTTVKPSGANGLVAKDQQPVITTITIYYE